MFLTLNINLQWWFLYKSDVRIFTKNVNQASPSIIEITTTQIKDKQKTHKVWNYKDDLTLEIQRWFKVWIKSSALIGAWKCLVWCIGKERKKFWVAGNHVRDSINSVQSSLKSHPLKYMILSPELIQLST